MKYIVELIKTERKIVVIDANSEEECDKKLINGETEKEWSRIDTAKVYGDYEYVKHTEENEDELLMSADDIARKIYGIADESTLERELFKYTECGMCATWDNDAINLVGYVEGYDGEMPTAKLDFPFTISKYKETCKELDALAENLWNEIHESEEGDE